MSRLDEIEARMAHEPCCDHRATHFGNCTDCHNTGCAHPLYVEDEAKDDMAALLAFAREMESRHQPEPAPSFTESSYEMNGQIPGALTLSGFASRDVTCCKGCHVEYPCPTARALEQVGGAS
jgi:hypothetical protein